MNAAEMLTDAATRKMVTKWLTGNDEKDAKTLARTFPRIMSLAQWRQVVAETKAAR